MREVLIYIAMGVWLLFLCAMWFKWFDGSVETESEEGALCMLTILWWVVVIWFL